MYKGKIRLDRREFLLCNSLMKKTNTTANYDYFIKLDTAPYRGKWIAIAKNKVAAVSKTANQAFSDATKKYPQENISLAKVPSQNTLILRLNK